MNFGMVSLLRSSADGSSLYERVGRRMAESTTVAEFSFRLDAEDV